MQDDGVEFDLVKRLTVDVYFKIFLSGCSGNNYEPTYHSSTKTLSVIRNMVLRKLIVGDRIPSSHWNSHWHVLGIPPVFVFSDLFLLNSQFAYRNTLYKSYNNYESPPRSSLRRFFFGRPTLCQPVRVIPPSITNVPSKIVIPALFDVSKVKVNKIEICMAPVKTGDRSDLIYSPARKYGLDRC